MTGRRKLYGVAVGIVAVTAAVWCFVGSSGVQPKATVVVGSRTAGRPVALLSVTNATARNFAVFYFLQEQRQSAWSDAVEQPTNAGVHMILRKGEVTRFELEISPAAGCYRFRCGYEPLEQTPRSMRVYYALYGLIKGPGRIGVWYRSALERMQPWPKWICTDALQAREDAQGATGGLKLGN